eukprot:gene11245-11394_t
MGAPMAANLIKAGLPVMVFDRNPAAVEKLVKLGASSADSPQQIGQSPGVTAVISMLPSTEHVTDAYEGVREAGGAGRRKGWDSSSSNSTGLTKLQWPTGLLKASGGLHPSLIIDCSTILPTYTSKLAATIANKVQLAPDARKVPGAAGPVFADAPVSGGVPGAVAATLTFMCGGSSVALRAAKPLLQLMGKRIEHLGLTVSRPKGTEAGQGSAVVVKSSIEAVITAVDPGAGQVAKICNNLALAIQMAGVAEALALGAAAGLDPSKLSAVFNSSSARCWSSDSYNPVPGVLHDVPASNDYQGGFNAALMSKDLRLAMQLAISCKQPFAMGESAARLYQQVVESAGRPIDFGGIYKYVYRGRPSSHINNVPSKGSQAP